MLRYCSPLTTNYGKSLNKSKLKITILDNYPLYRCRIRYETTEDVASEVLTFMLLKYFGDS